MQAKTTMLTVNLRVLFAILTLSLALHSFSFGNVKTATGHPAVYGKNTPLAVHKSINEAQVILLYGHFLGLLEKESAELGFPPNTPGAGAQDLMVKGRPATTVAETQAVDAFNRAFLTLFDSFEARLALVKIHRFSKFPRGDVYKGRIFVDLIRIAKTSPFVTEPETIEILRMNESYFRGSASNVRLFNESGELVTNRTNKDLFSKLIAALKSAGIHKRPRLEVPEKRGEILNCTQGMAF